MTSPAWGDAPSAPPVKRCRTVFFSPLSLNTTPQPVRPLPPQSCKLPPNAVVPYKEPFASMIRFALGVVPSGPAKLCSTVSTPLVSSLNTVPQPIYPELPQCAPFTLPPNDVVP